MRYQDRIKAYVKSSINISAAFLLGEKAFKEANKGLIDVDAVWDEIKSNYPDAVVSAPAEEVVLDTLADISDLEPLDEASDEIGDVEGDYPKRKKKRAKNS